MWTFWLTPTDLAMTA
jgi:hypothetical protein